MARTAGGALRLLGLLLWLLLLYLASALPLASASQSALLRSPASHLSDHFLNINIIITPIPGPKQPWCEAQVGVDGEPCFSYDCQSDEVKAFCVLGMKVEAPLNEQMRDILKDLTTEFRGKLLDIKPKDSQSGEPLSLQATMVLQEKAGVLINGFWQFLINGGISLCLNLVNKTWKMNHTGDMGMLEKWKEDRDMNPFLLKMSYGDCKMWLQGVAVYWEMLEITAPLNTIPGTFESTSTVHEPWFISMIITCSFLVLIAIGFITKKLLQKSLCHLRRNLDKMFHHDHQELAGLAINADPCREVLTEVLTGADSSVYV